MLDMKYTKENSDFETELTDAIVKFQGKRNIKIQQGGAQLL